jgi:tetratricopeptide (TPR) repeat protein
MAPKKKDDKKDAAPAPIVSDAPEVPEEEEEGPGKATFDFAVSRICNLPVELETMVVLSGPIKEKLSGPSLSAEAAEGTGHEASGWEWEKSRSIRLIGQTLFDDIVSKPLTIKVHDVRGDNALVGKATLSLSPLLHDQLEVGGDIVLELTPAYRAKWFPEDAAAAAPDAANTEGVANLPEVPITTIGVTMTVQDLLGPVEDRQSWLTVSLGLKGAFALPSRVTGLGITGPEDVESHQLKYQAVILGETLDRGALTAPAQTRPDPPEPPEPPADADPDADPDAEQVPPEEPPEAEWREQQQLFEFSVRFKEDQIVRYRGAKFIKDFRYMLNNTGGVWCYFIPQEKEATDPKKPNLPEIGNLSRHFAGKAWLELQDLINPDTLRVEKNSPLISTNRLEETALEPTLESSRSFVRLTLELDRGVTLPEAAETRIPMSQLLSSRKDFNTFPSSNDAADLYKEAVQRSFSTMCSECPSGVGEVQEVVENLKRGGCYGNVKQDLRSAIVRIFHERLRKDPNMVPGKPLDADASKQFFSDGYTYLKEAMTEVLDALQGEAESSPVLPVDDVSASPQEAEPCPADPFVAALRESAAARQSRAALGVAADARERCVRLAYEAEMIGNWERAANLFQNSLLLNDDGKDPLVWIQYAKFCMRARGRQASAEEALQQAVQLLAPKEAGGSGIDVPKETAIELDLMLGCLLLDRGRHDEAIRVFRERHKIDFGGALPRFLLGLALFLADEDPAEWKPLLAAVAKPKEWFHGLPDDKAVADKLKMFSHDKSVDPAPFADCLEKLLEFGFPSLVFTFLDQCETLPADVLASEPIALVDAKAAMLDKNWAGASARLEPVLERNGGQDASRDVWRLAGECHFQLQDFEKALHQLQYALSFENKFEDPFVYIRWGHVLLLKKRWPKAKDAFLRSIHCKPTAEAWSGVGYAAYQSQELRECYEALREANLLDNERSDVWAQLCLVHLRFDSTDLADHCFRQCVKYNPESDELLLDIANECVRRDVLPEVAEAAARLALTLRDSGQGHSSLADAFVKRGDSEKGVLEAQIAIRLLPDRPEDRKAIFERALKWVEDLGDTALAESLHAVQRLADQQEVERSQSQSP